MCPPSSKLPRFYRSDASAYSFFREVRALLSRPTPRRSTPIATTALLFRIGVGTEGMMDLRLIA